MLIEFYLQWNKSACTVTATTATTATTASTVSNIKEKLKNTRTNVSSASDALILRESFIFQKFNQLRPIYT